MDKKNSTNKDKQTFYQYVLNTVSVANFNKLPQELGITKRMLTVRLMNPNKMTFSMIKMLSHFLKSERGKLVDKYELGFDKLTVREYKQLITKQE